MSDIVVEIIDESSRQSISSVEKHLLRHNKTYVYNGYNKLAAVHTNDITIGLIGIINNGEELEVSIYQAPSVCRMSILSLIEASVHLALNLVSETTVRIVFKNIIYAHRFKIQQMVPSCIDVGNNLVLDKNDLLSTDLTTVSLKRVYIENL